MELTVRTADRVSEGVLDIPAELVTTTTVGDLLTTLRKEFGLPPSTDYFLRSERQGRQLDSTLTLHAAGIAADDVLDVTPILQAGA